MSKLHLLRLRTHSCVCRVATQYRNHYISSWTRQLKLQNSTLSTISSSSRSYSNQVLHHLSRLTQLPFPRTSRWYSGTNQGGGASGGGSGNGGARKGFFQNFMDNMRKGFNQNREMQESLKGFHEEREKLQKSYVLQQAKQKVIDVKDKALEYGGKGIELTKQGYSRLRLTTSKVNKVICFLRLESRERDGNINKDQSILYIPLSTSKEFNGAVLSRNTSKFWK